MPDDKDNIPPGVTSYLDDIAQHLRELNGGKRIPVEWTRYLLQALRKRAARLAPKRKRQGRPLNLHSLEAVAYEIARRSLGPSPVVAKTSPYRDDPDKAKSVLPEEEKRRLSKQCGCSVRTITSLQSIVDRVLPEPSKHSSPSKPKKPARSPSDEEHGVVLNGFRRAICEVWKRKDEEGRRRRKERLENARRKLIERS